MDVFTSFKAMRGIRAFVGRGGGGWREGTPLLIASTTWRKDWPLPTTRRCIILDTNENECKIGENGHYRLFKVFYAFSPVRERERRNR